MVVYEIKYLTALVFTAVTETAVLLLLMRSVFIEDYRKISIQKIISAGIFASASTLPHLWLVLPAFIENRLIYGITGELGVLVIEAVFYYFFIFSDWKRSFLTSFLCNLVSFLLGILIL
jgi:hypothetical protein